MESSLGEVLTNALVFYKIRNGEMSTIKDACLLCEVLGEKGDDRDFLTSWARPSLD